jgi:hypothetical protein
LSLIVDPLRPRILDQLHEPHGMCSGVDRISAVTINPSTTTSGSCHEEPCSTRPAGT